MNPEEASYSPTEQIVPPVDGRHPFDQGASVMHWSAVMADIDARTPHLPELNIQISKTETLPTEGVVLFDAAVDAPITEEKATQGRIARAKEALALFGETLKLPELKPLAVPALAVAVAACNASGPTPTQAHPETTSPAPIVSQAPSESPTASESNMPSASASAEATPDVSPTTEPTAEPTPQPKSIETIYNAEKYPGIADLKPGKILKATLDAMYQADSKAELIYKEALAITDITNAQKGDDFLGNTLLSKREGAITSISLMYTVYFKTGDIKFYNKAKALFGYVTKPGGIYSDSKGPGSKAELEKEIAKNLKVFGAVITP